MTQPLVGLIASFPSSRATWTVLLNAVA